MVSHSFYVWPLYNFSSPLKSSCSFDTYFWSSRSICTSDSTPSYDLVVSYYLLNFWFVSRDIIFNGFNDNSPMSPGPFVTVKKRSPRQLLLQFSKVLDVKKETTVPRLGAAKSKRKSIRRGGMLWSIITKRRGNTIINGQVETALYNSIIGHPQVTQSLCFIFIFIDFQ